MKRILLLTLLLLTLPLATAYGAYHHGTDTDSDLVLQAYPAIEGTKLDSCALCHTGGEYEKKPGSWVALGSCQWCHYSYGYDASGDIDETLNSYGASYRDYNGDFEALVAIEDKDADEDGFSNIEEIAALRYPGNPEDDPMKVTAPYRVVSIEELENMEIQTQFMLMNTHKSGDFYAEYSGVPMADLLDGTGMLESATGITIFAPDGWAQYHPLEQDEDPLLYHVYGSYPEATFFYDDEANEALNKDGWCDYSSPLPYEMTNGDPIIVPNGLQLILAFARDGEYLQAGELTEDNKLDGEGPFRVVPPQKIPGPPDQSIKSTAQKVIWPFDNDADHNAGFATRSATMIKVEPLPEGTTEVDTLEAGWDFVDEGKIIIYGAIDPIETVLLKIRDLKALLRDFDNFEFRHRFTKRILVRRLSMMERFLKRGHERVVDAQLQGLSRKFDGCAIAGEPDRNDWLTGCNEQLAVYWAIHELNVLLDIEH
jgi:hypothetical protein